MNAASYLCLAGVEVANSMRTLSYLLRGLGGIDFDVASTGAAKVVAGYTDVYDDAYVGDVSFASQLDCYCSDLDDPSNFLAPAADPAPWYDATNPASGEFLGVMFDTFDLGTGGGRAVTTRASGGGSLGRLRVKPRILQVHGHLYANSQRGMAYGERWLAKALAGSMCADCGGDTAEVLPACSDVPPPVVPLVPVYPSSSLYPSPSQSPGAQSVATTSPSPAPSQFRTLYEVGLIDGPVFAPIPAVPACTMQEVSFQLAAGNPYLHHGGEPRVLALDVPWVATSFPVVTGEWSGDVAVTLEIEAVGDLSGLTVIATPQVMGSTCSYDPSLTSNPCARYDIGPISDGDRLTIDATSRRVTRWDNTSKAVASGFDSLVFTGPFPWLLVPPCSQTCITLIVGASGRAKVTVTEQEREL